MSRNAGALRFALLTFLPFAFGGWTMTRYELADGNDPMLLLIPIGFAAGLWFAISQRHWLMAWAKGVRRGWVGPPVFALGAGFFLFGVVNAINGAFAAGFTRELSGKVVYFCCRDDDEPSIRMVPDADPEREISLSVSPAEYVALRRMGAPIAVSVRRGLLGRDIVVGYRLAPDTLDTATAAP